MLQNSGNQILQRLPHNSAKNIYEATGQDFRFSVDPHVLLMKDLIGRSFVRFVDFPRVAVKEPCKFPATAQRRTKIFCACKT